MRREECGPSKDRWHSNDRNAALRLDKDGKIPDFASGAKARLGEWSREPKETIETARSTPFYRRHQRDAINYESRQESRGESRYGNLQHCEGLNCYRLLIIL